MKAKLLVFIPILVGIAGLYCYFRKDNLIGVILLASAFLFLSALLLWSIRKGFDNAVFMKDIEIEHEALKQRFKVDSLYKNLSHTQEWLQGFALGAEFFIENYLTEETVGPTEKGFWEFTRQYTASEGHGDAQFTPKAYRIYMITSLMRENNVTEEEYRQIARMMTKDGAKETLGQVIYSGVATEMAKEDAKSIVINNSDEKE